MQIRRTPSNRSLLYLWEGIWLDRIPVMQQQIIGLEKRMDKLEGRHEQLEKLMKDHREEFIETRTYVKESYAALNKIQLGIESLKQQTAERIEQQGRYYREELAKLKEQPSADDSAGETKRTYDFAWKVIAGILALATAILGLLQIQGG